MTRGNQFDIFAGYDGLTRGWLLAVRWVLKPHRHESGVIGSVCTEHLPPSARSWQNPSGFWVLKERGMALRT